MYSPQSYNQKDTETQPFDLCVRRNGSYRVYPHAIAVVGWACLAVGVVSAFWCSPS